jgi:hypothetical protein
VRALVGQLPVGSLKFESAVPGQVGVMTRNAQGFLDTFKLSARTVLNWRNLLASAASAPFAARVS